MKNARQVCLCKRPLHEPARDFSFNFFFQWKQNNLSILFKITIQTLGFKVITCGQLTILQYRRQCKVEIKRIFKSHYLKRWQIWIWFLENEEKENYLQWKGQRSPSTITRTADILLYKTKQIENRTLLFNFSHKKKENKRNKSYERTLYIAQRRYGNVYIYSIRSK